MTKLLVCSVYDNAVKAYLQPFFMRSRAEAVRNFAAAANNKEHSFNAYPGDYHLFALGHFDEETGKFDQFEVADNLGSALEHITNDPQPGQLKLSGVS